MRLAWLSPAPTPATRRVKQSAKILDEQLKKRKEMMTHFELTHEVKKEHTLIPIFNL